MKPQIWKDRDSWFCFDPIRDYCAMGRSPREAYFNNRIFPGMMQ